MFSVENLYYVLYNNLLKPNNIVDSFFTPFGSTAPNDLKTFTFHDFNNTGEMEHLKICLFWDQEPLFQKSFDAVTTQYAGKFLNNSHCKILANSEHSLLKDQICKQNNFLDFYFFYHGFAALDWFRDYKYLSKTNNFDNVFITLNRLCTEERSYRLSLVANLLEKDLLKHGLVSLHFRSKPNIELRQELFSQSSFLSQKNKKLIYKHLWNRNQNFLLDSSVTGSASANFGNYEHKFLQSSLWHVVTETVFYHDKKHLTEKIFKPIVNFRPFILVGAYKNLEYLKSYGFKTFDRWIDESYDNEPDPDVRLEKIIKTISDLCRLSKTELTMMYSDMLPVLEYNQQHFFTDFKKIIVKELLNNWFNLIQRWNNGIVAENKKLSSYIYNRRELFDKFIQ